MMMLVVAVFALVVLRWVTRRAGRPDTAGLLSALLLPASFGSPASALKCGVDQSTLRLRSKRAVMRVRL